VLVGCFAASWSFVAPGAWGSLAVLSESSESVTWELLVGLELVFHQLAGRHLTKHGKGMRNKPALNLKRACRFSHRDGHVDGRSYRLAWPSAPPPLPRARRSGLLKRRSRLPPPRCGRGCLTRVAQALACRRCCRWTCWSAKNPPRCRLKSSVLRSRLEPSTRNDAGKDGSASIVGRAGF